MTKGRNVTLAEINKISGAHHKIFNEDRLILSAAKCSFYKCKLCVDMYRLVTKTPK